MQASPFEADSEITRYYEMLPEGPLANEYREMLAAGDARERTRRQERLRRRATPGSIDVNIMVKGDRDIYRDGQTAAAPVQRRLGRLARLRREPARLLDHLLRGHESAPVHLRGRVSRLLPRPFRPAEEDDRVEGQRFPFRRRAGEVPREARAVGLGIPDRIGVELRRPRLRHPRPADGADPGRVPREARRTGRAIARRLCQSAAGALAARPARRRLPSASRRKAALGPPRRIACCGSTTASTAPAGARRSC